MFQTSFYFISLAVFLFIMSADTNLLVRHNKYITLQRTVNCILTKVRKNTLLNTLITVTDDTANQRHNEQSHIHKYC
jgi:hypothetical protein